MRFGNLTEIREASGAVSKKGEEKKSRAGPAYSQQEAVKCLSCGDFTHRSRDEESNRQG